jgi:hypothetical protein
MGGDASANFLALVLYMRLLRQVIFWRSGWRIGIDACHLEDRVFVNANKTIVFRD